MVAAIPPLSEWQVNIRIWQILTLKPLGLAWQVLKYYWSHEKKEIPWMMQITTLKVSYSLPTVLTPSRSLQSVSTNPQHLSCGQNYQISHYHTDKTGLRNMWKCNSLRKGSNHGTSFCGLTMAVIPYPIHVIGKVTDVKHCMIHATLCFILQLWNWASILNTKISKHSQLWNPVMVIWWGCKPEIIWPPLNAATAVGYNNNNARYTLKM